MMRFALAAMLLPAAAGQATCTSGSCCTPKVTGMCGYNTHDESGDLLSTAVGNTYTTTDTSCGADSELIATAAAVPKPASTETGAAAAAAICCMCPDGYSVDANFAGCTVCDAGKFVPASTNRATATTCTDVSKCDTYSCAAGTSQKSDAGTTACTDYPAGTGACTVGTTNQALCCEDNQCKLPASTTGYTTAGTATTSAKGTLTGACSDGYAGTAAGACAADDGEWALSGCTAKVVTEYCTDAADTDDTDTELDTYTCAEESFALPDVLVTCATVAASTGTCTRTTTQPTPYQILGLWMTDQPAALGTAFADDGTMCTATPGTAASCTGADDGTGTACALNAGGSACEVDAGDCAFTPKEVTCTVTVSETTCPEPETQGKTSSARSATPFALVMIAAAVLA